MATQEHHTRLSPVWNKNHSPWDCKYGRQRVPRRSCLQAERERLEFRGVILELASWVPHEKLTGEPPRDFVKTQVSTIMRLSVCPFPSSLPFLSFLFSFPGGRYFLSRKMNSVLFCVSSLNSKLFHCYLCMTFPFDLYHCYLSILTLVSCY